jgi:hypothetical protein
MKLTDNSPMPFGKYKGIPMRDVEAAYLLELKERDYRCKCKPEHHSAVLRYIEENEQVLLTQQSFPMEEPEWDEIDESIDYDMFISD